MAVVMIVIGLLILAMNQWFVGKRKSFTTISGKSSQVSIVNLRKSRNPISFALIILLSFIAILPLVSFAVESFILAPGDYSLSNITSIFWIGAGRTDISNKN